MTELKILQNVPLLKLKGSFSIRQLSNDFRHLKSKRNFDSVSKTNFPLYDAYSKLKKFYYDGEDSHYEHISLTTYGDNKLSRSRFFQDEKNINCILGDVPEYTKSVIETFSPYFHRCRFSTLIPGGQVKPHRDYGLNYSVRLHIPIITNPQAMVGFEDANLENTNVHLPADGSIWFFNQSIKHWAENNGQEPRTHLIIAARPECLKQIYGNA